MRKFLVYKSVTGFIERHNLTILEIKESEIVFLGSVPESREGEAIFSEDFVWQDQAIFHIENREKNQVVLRLIA